MSKKPRVVHINFDENDHTKLRNRAEQCSIPMAILCKLAVINELRKDPEQVATVQEIPLLQQKKTTMNK